jgi:hypothetical protein
MSELSKTEVATPRDTEQLLAAALIAANNTAFNLPWRQLGIGILAFSGAAALSYIGFGWRDAAPIEVRPFPLLPFVLGIAAASRLGGAPAKWLTISGSIFVEAWVLPPENSLAIATAHHGWFAQFVLGVVVLGLLIPTPVDLLAHDKIRSRERFGRVGDVKACLAALYEKIVGNRRDIDHHGPAPRPK